MKKALSAILALTFVFSLAIPCSAHTVSGLDWSGSNVSNVDPLDIIVPFGTEAPKDGYNLHTNALYSFSGKASWSTLWLNKNLYGCTKYSVYINNKSSQTLTFTIRGISGGDRTMTLPGNTDTVAYYGDSGMTFNTNSTSTLFCISFNAPSNFEGWVSCAD